MGLVESELRRNIKKKKKIAKVLKRRKSKALDPRGKQPQIAKQMRTVIIKEFLLRGIFPNFSVSFGCFCCHIWEKINGKKCFHCKK